MEQTKTLLHKFSRRKDVIQQRFRRKNATSCKEAADANSTNGASSAGSAGSPLNEQHTAAAAAAAAASLSANFNSTLTQNFLASLLHNEISCDI